MTPAICDFGLPRKCMWLGDHGGFPCSSAVQNPPATQKIWETQVGFLVWEDYLEKGMTTDSSILAWRIPWTEEPGGLQFIGSQRLRHDWSDSMHTHARTHTHAHTHTHTHRWETMGGTGTSQDTEALPPLHLRWLSQEMKHHLLKRVCKCLHFCHPVAVCFTTGSITSYGFW